MILHTNDYFKWSAEKPKPQQDLIEHALYQAERAYGRFVRWELPDDWFSHDRFMDAVNRLDMTSSPGIPYCREATSNRTWLGFNGLICDPFKLERLWQDVLRVKRGEWEHLIRVFVKQEPHKNAKAVEGRWRLIMASSLCVQVVWHMLFDFQNDLEIQYAYHIPSQQGIVLTGGGWARYRQQWEHRGLTQGLDKSAWDWTCSKWLLDMDLQFRFRCGSGGDMGNWFKLASEMYDRMFVDPILVLSDGTMWKQVVPGVMKSGCVNTISTNSHCQVFVHFMVAKVQGIDPNPVCVACGDDTLQHPDHVTDIARYEQFGVRVKSASDAMEFVGHEFVRQGPQPLYMAKHVKRVRYVTDDILPQYFDAMARMYVHTRYFEIWKQLAARCGCSLPMSKEAYLHWYDVPED